MWRGDGFGGDGCGGGSGWRGGDTGMMEGVVVVVVDGEFERQE